MLPQPGFKGDIESTKMALASTSNDRYESSYLMPLFQGKPCLMNVSLIVLSK